MIRPDFNKLDNATVSTTVNGGDSEIVWREFLVASQFFINHCSFKVKEDELVEITKSLQNWTYKRKHQEYKEFSNGSMVVSQVVEGDIFIADLGMNFQELAYCHPVIVMEIIDNKALVLPLTSTISKINTAYHPSSNPNGDRNYRKVFQSDGFEVDSAIIINEMRLISKGRLIERKGRINEDITHENSIFLEVKESSFQKFFSSNAQKIFSLEQEIIELNNKIKELEEKQEQMS